MTPTRFSAIAAVLIIFALSIFSFFIVREGESALILRLGKIVSDDQGLARKLMPGLHMKIPFIDTVRIFDMRMQELATPASQPLTVVTKEQTYLVVDYSQNGVLMIYQNFIPAPAVVFPGQKLY